jgi:hypothetical protein
MAINSRGNPAMPDRLSYDEAMLYASRTLKIQDPDIKQGTVEIIIISTAVGPIKKPWGLEGGFAVVYKYRTQSGQMKAMRCFRVPMTVDTRSRYEKMSGYFRQYIPDITIDFRYYEEGILVKESVQSTQKMVCPVIVMEWVEGMTLLDAVDNLCRKRDTLTLGALAEGWLNLVQRMWQANMAHGDLAGVNVMVRPDGQLTLIDYDGVYIPEFKGMQQIVLGQIGYQHPQMHLRQFNEHMDDFSALVIYLSLLSLQGQPELWERYVQRNAKGQLDGNMLFTRDDFNDPDGSPVFADLLKSSDLQVRDLTRFLHDACLQSIIQMRFPGHICDPNYANKQALQRLEQALQRSDYEQVIKEWETYLKAYAPAQKFEARVNEAIKRKAALNAISAALASHDVLRIAAIATPENLANPHIGAIERRTLEAAVALAKALDNNDDEQIVNCWQEIQQGPLHDRFVLSAQQSKRFQLAEQRKTLLSQFRIACHQSQYRRARIILSSYSPILDGSPNFSKKDRELVDAARRYVDMVGKVRRTLRLNNGQGDVTQFTAAYDEELDKCFDDFLPEERRQIEALSKYGKLNRALTGKAYRLALVTARDIERQTGLQVFDQRLSEAREQFMKMIDARNLRVQVQATQAYAWWEWPYDDLIERARIVWRGDRWPLPPQQPDQGRREQWAIRSVYEQFGGFSFSTGGIRQLYIQVYFVMKDYDEQTREPRWLYSRGSEPTSRWCGTFTV